MEQMCLADFQSEKLEEKQKEQTHDARVMQCLSEKSSAEIAVTLRNCSHPKPEFGDGESWRSYYLSECERRGKNLLQELDWTSELADEYVNIHTGCVEALGSVMNRHVHSQGNYDYVWNVIECWEPYDKSKPNAYLINYLRKEISNAEHALLQCRKGESPHGMSIPVERKWSKRALTQAREKLQQEQQRRNRISIPNTEAFSPTLS